MVNEYDYNDEQEAIASASDQAQSEADTEADMMAAIGAWTPPIIPPAQKEKPPHPDDDRVIEYEVELVGEEDHDVDWLPTRVNETDLLKSMMSEAQLAIITGHVPREAVSVRPLDNQGVAYAVYITHWVVRRILNAAFLNNWGQVIEGREYWKNPVSNHWEARCWGHLWVQGANGQIRKEPFEAAHRMALTKNLTSGQDMESAMSKGLTKAATKLGIGMSLNNPRIKEQMLTYHGVQRKPLAKHHNELRKALGVHRAEEVGPAILALEIPFEDWELNSRDRVEAITKEANYRKG